MTIDRRFVLRAGLVMGPLSSLISLPVRAQSPAVMTRRVASIDQELPLVGLGSWITFNVALFCLNVVRPCGLTVRH